MDKSFDELLAELDVEESKDEGREPEPRENQAFKQLRAAYKQREKENEKLLREVEAFRTKERVSTLTAAGLTGRQAEAFTKMYDDVTAENITSFKTEVLGVKEAPPEDSEAVQGAAPNAQSFAPSAGGEPPGSKVYEYHEWAEIMKRDPVQGRLLAENGKVKWTYEEPPSLKDLIGS